MTRTTQRMTTRKCLWLAFGFIWLISPIDLIPDCIPGLGNLDDATVMAVVIKKVLEQDETK